MIYQRDGRTLATDFTRSVALKAKLFRGLADPSRLGIIEAMRDGARCVSEIVEATALTQPNVSNHLACLFDCGLVRRERRGRFVYYELSQEHVRELLSAADDLLSEIAPGVYVCPRYEQEQSPK